MSATHDLRFLTLGIGDFFSRYHYSTSFVVLAGEKAILIDCPSPLRKMVHEAATRARFPLSVDDINDVILTHLHGDHANGLEEFAFYKRFIQKRKPLLHTIPEVLENVWEHRLKASMGTLSDSDCNNHQVQTLDDYYDVQVVDEAQPSRIGDLQLAIRRTRHFLPCFGMRLTCAGLTLGYSSDTVFDPKHIEFLAESDVIIHETSSGAGHTPAGKLAELPDDIRKKLYLVHIADHFDVAKCPLPVLEEGRLYSVRQLSERSRG